jgi:hypothetical protein
MAYRKHESPVGHWTPEVGCLQCSSWDIGVLQFAMHAVPANYVALKSGNPESMASISPAGADLWSSWRVDPCFQCAAHPQPLRQCEPKANDAHNQQISLQIYESNTTMYNVDNAPLGCKSASSQYEPLSTASLNATPRSALSCP